MARKTVETAIGPGKKIGRPRTLNREYRIDPGMKLPTPDAETLQKFLSQLDCSGGLNSCWPWQAGTDKDGYGQLNIYYSPKHKVVLKSHQCAFEWLGRKGIPKKAWVLHKCDNPPCCNPAHLYAGDHRRNMQDVVSRGRQRGERNPAASLTDARVEKIFELSAAKKTQKEIQLELSISAVQVCRILKGERWGHVNVPRLGLAQQGVVVSIVAPPFTRWVGGKTRLQSELQNRLPANYAELRHIEPFTGGGALFFAMAPKRAVLCDSNPDLINTYLQIRDNLAAVSAELEWLADEHSDEAYYAVREAFNDERDKPESALAAPLFNVADPRGTGTALRAAVFLYMLSVNFNGIYRVNKDGKFNVPVGDRKTPDIRNTNILGRCRALLVRPEVQIHCRDFRYTMNHAGAGDFVYLDPPYHPASETSNFTGYTADGFTEADQLALRDYVRSASDRGAHIMLSNHDTPFVRELYADFAIESLEAPRSVGAKTRESAQEVIVRNYAT